MLTHMKTKSLFLGGDSEDNVVRLQDCERQLEEGLDSKESSQR